MREIETTIIAAIAILAAFPLSARGLESIPGTHTTKTTLHMPEDHSREKQARTAAQRQDKERFLLTDEDHALAKSLDFSDDSLGIIKKSTGSPLFKVLLSRYGWETKPDMEGIQFVNRPYPQEAFEAVKSIGEAYPELAKVVDNRLSEMKEHNHRIAQTPKMDRWSEARQEFKKFWPYMHQYCEENGIAFLDHSQSVMVPTPGQTHEEALQELLKKLRKQFAGVALKAKYRPIQGVIFYLPGFDTYEQVRRLREELRPIGYTVYSYSSSWSMEEFDDLKSLQKAEAEAERENANPQPRIVKERKDIITFDPQRDDAKAFKFVFNGRRFKLVKLAENKWEITHPPAYSLQRLIQRAVLVKEADVDQYRYLELTRTSGPNYGVSNENLIAKLKEWDAKYGITVSGAAHDSVCLSLHREPDDLDRFLTEVYLFCPDTIEVSSDPILSACEMRKFARRFRKSLSMELWWD